MVAQLTAKACADPTSTAAMAAVNLSADMLPGVERRGTDGRQHRLTLYSNVKALGPNRDS